MSRRRKRPEEHPNHERWLVSYADFITLLFAFFVTLYAISQVDAKKMTTLAQYYLRTDQYQRALGGSVNLAVGRKGSGKTALFVQLRDKIRRDKRNVTLDMLHD